MAVLEVIGLIFFIITLLTGLVLIILGVPGTFLIWLASLVYGIVTEFYEVSVATVLILLGIAVLGEIVEFVSGLYGARKFGASRLGMMFALIGGIAGGIVGSVIFPLVGTVVGVLSGAFFGAFSGEKLLKKEWSVSVRAGFGAFVGRMGGTFVKLVLGMIMVSIILSKVFFR